MGLNHLSTAAVIALLGAASALHAEAATEISAAAEAPANAAALLKSPSAAPAAVPAPTTEPASTVAATAPAEDSALKASPIAGTTPSEPPAAQPLPAPETQPSAAPEMAPPPAVEPTAPAEPAPVTKGDVLTVPKSAPAPASKKSSSGPITIEVDGMPGRGASMAQVSKHFGEPQQKLAPVGEPPITRWIYGDYTVYFEHEYVIHSVRNDGSAVPEQPAAASSPTTEAPPASEQ